MGGVAAAVLTEPAWLTCHFPLCGGGREEGGELAQQVPSRPSRSTVNPRRGGGKVVGVVVERGNWLR